MDPNVIDPNFIHLDWERSIDAIALVALVAILVERALSLLFESRLYIERLDRDGLKETIALALSVATCRFWDLDVVSMIVLTKPQTQLWGYLITGAVVAGGSKGSQKLFQDLLDLQSSAFRARYSIQAAKAAEEAEKAEMAAEAAPSRATAEVAKEKAAAAVRKAVTAASKAEFKGHIVPATSVAKAEAALARAAAAARSKET
ncbi:MAG: hypothetical protein ACT4PE_02375 [Candidatus Eiseniibacteriota bacterium]